MQVHLIIKGKVQGIGFRAYTQEQARSLGVTGWVKNLKDGTVEVIAEGSRDVLNDFIRRLLRGPPLASVGKMDERWEETDERLEDFSIIR